MVIVIISMAILLVIALVLRKGKGSWLIAGYNSMSEKEKAKYDEKKLCKDVSSILFGIIASMGVSVVGELFNITWLSTVSLILILLIVVVGVIAANVRSRS